MGVRILVGGRQIFPSALYVRSASAATAKAYDQFLTTDAVAAACWGYLARHLPHLDFQFIEPSAGQGAFLRVMPGDTIGIEVMPSRPGLIWANFLDVQIESDRDIIVVGNPPFGVKAGLAIGFFNHAARFASKIAMIVLACFGKHAVQRRLASDFHLVAEYPVPDKAFLFCGAPKSVRTVFQIWERRDVSRVMTPGPSSHPHFTFTTCAHEAYFAMRRVGYTAGKVIDKDDANQSTFHYIIDRTKTRKVAAIMAEIDFTSVTTKTTAVRSLSQPEVVALYTAHLAKRRITARRRWKRFADASVRTHSRRRRARQVLWRRQP